MTLRLCAVVACAVLSAGCGRSGLFAHRDEELWPAAGDEGEEDWYGLGGSELAPRSTFVAWGSATGGGVSNSVYGTALHPAQALDPSGYPIIAWVEPSTTPPEIRVRRWDGTTWQELGAGAKDGLVGYNPSLALDSVGRPLIAWGGGGGSVVYVKRFDGQAWQELGAGSGSGAGIGPGWVAALALDGAGNPVVAWQSGGGAIFIKRFDGTSWKEVGSGSASGAGIATGYEVALALDGAGRPVVAWSTSAAAVYVQRFDGTVWQEVGAGSASGVGMGWGSEPALALDGAGRPVVAWRDANGFLYAKRFDGAAWTEIGSGSATGAGISSPASCRHPSLAIDAFGQPIVAWLSEVGAAHLMATLHVKRFDGVSWRPVGATSSSGIGARASSFPAVPPSLALDAGGNPAVAWVQVLGGAAYVTEVYWKRFDGDRWRELGELPYRDSGLSGGSGASSSPSLAFDPQGSPAVAWTEQQWSGASGIWLRHYDGSSWEEVGSGSAAGAGLGVSPTAQSRAALAFGADGRAVVAWDDLTDRPVVYVKRFDGMAGWQELGAGSASGVGIGAGSATRAWHAALALDGAGQPVVAWESGLDDGVYARRFDGASWQEVGVGSASAFGIAEPPASAPAIGLDADGLPAVAWRAGSLTGPGEIYVKRFDGAAWQEVGAGSASGGGISASGSDSASPSLAIDTHGQLLVAWSEAAGEIFIRRFDGTAWQEVGAGSASGGGVSNNTGASYVPSLAVDVAGRPVVAWPDTTSGNAEIYVRRFDGAAWQEVGAGSATGGGVSNSAAMSSQPSVATWADQLCVAWSEPGRSSLNIMMRCTNR